MKRVAPAMIVLVAGTLAANTWAKDGHVSHPRCDELCRFLEKDSNAMEPTELHTDHPASPMATQPRHLLMPRMPHARVVVADRRLDADTAAAIAQGVAELGNPLFIPHTDLLRSVGPPTLARFALLKVAAQNSAPVTAGLFVTTPMLPPAAVPPGPVPRGEVPPGALAPAIRQVATVVLGRDTAPVETIEGSSAGIVETPLVPSRGNEAEPLPPAAASPLPTNDQALVEPPPFDVIAALMLASPRRSQHASVARAY